jgi:hypothetical protein
MHDRNGTELKKGDIVLIEAEVTDLQPGADKDYCNVNIKPVKAGTVNGATPMIENFCTCTKFVTLSKRLPTIILIVLAVLCGAVGCIQTSTRQYDFHVDPNGVFDAHAKVLGADAQIGSVTLKGPDGFDLEVTGYSAQDKVAALSAAQNMKALELLASLLERLEAFLPGGGSAPIVSSATPATKAVKAVRAKKVKVPATQPAVKK